MLDWSPFRRGRSRAETRLHYPAFLKNDGMVSIATGPQAMGDHNHRTVIPQALEGLLDLFLGHAVERIGRLVEDWEPASPKSACRRLGRSFGMRSRLDLTRKKVDTTT
jgi:hypothetical protein